MDRPIDKWFTIDNKEIFLENAKEFFFDFRCNFNWMEHRIKDFLQLKIPQTTIIDWSMEYYRKDIQRYDHMNLSDKLFYLGALSASLDQFEKPFIIDIAHKFLNFLSIPGILELYNSIFYLSQMFILHFERLKKFTGFIPKLREINEEEILTIFINKLVEIITKYPNHFDFKYGYNKFYYYESLRLFNDTYQLGFKDLIEKLK